MSTWRMVIEFEWPDELPDGQYSPMHAPDTTVKYRRNMQHILFEVIEPFQRDNIVWLDARFELARDPDGDY